MKLHIVLNISAEFYFVVKD